MKASIIYLSVAAGCLALMVSSCRKDKSDGPGEIIKTTKGLLVLNEGGGFGAENASLDYYDYDSQKNTSDVYGTANSRNLGDVGQDVQVYGSRIYLVVNNSNRLTIVNSKTFKNLKDITIEQPRNIAFYNGKALITSYDDHVYVVDTASMAVEKTIAVGRDPEHLVVVGDKLYVANSGGLDYPDYDNTVSVVDLKTLQETKKITVDINLDNIVADKNGDVYVTSRGDYASQESNLYAVDTKTETVKKRFDIPAGSLAIGGDVLYVINYSYLTFKPAYTAIDVNTETVKGNFITDGTDEFIVQPYGIAADPVSGDVFLADAKDFQHAGTVYRFGKDGRKKSSFEAGVVPAHFAFLSN